MPLDKHSSPTSAALEKVLVKHKVVSIERHCRRLIHNARRQIKVAYQEMATEAQVRYRQAQYQGYQAGLEQLTSHLIQALESYQTHWQQTMSQAKKQFATAQQAQFNDPRMTAIVSEQLANMASHQPDITLWLPDKRYQELDKSFTQKFPHITVAHYQQPTITLDIGDHVIRFTPPTELGEQTEAILSDQQIYRESTRQITLYKEIKALIRQFFTTQETQQHDDQHHNASRKNEQS